jgi:hypothetical protein
VKPINMTREWQIQAKGWAALAEERRDRIERAIRAIHQAQTEHYFLDPQIWSGGDLIKDTEVAELLANLRKILEGSDD